MFHVLCRVFPLDSCLLFTAFSSYPHLLHNLIKPASPSSPDIPAFQFTFSYFRIILGVIWGQEAHLCFSPFPLLFHACIAKLSIYTSTWLLPHSLFRVSSFKSGCLEGPAEAPTQPVGQLFAPVAIGNQQSPWTCEAKWLIWAHLSSVIPCIVTPFLKASDHASKTRIPLQYFFSLIWFQFLVQEGQ